MARCLHPIDVSRVVAGVRTSISVPCGRCSACVKNKQEEYVYKSVSSSLLFGKVWFITLTYRDSCCPTSFMDYEDSEFSKEYIDSLAGDSGQSLSCLDVPTLRRSDLVDWKKRCREKYFRLTGNRVKFHFFLCGEYGPRTHRPHYHGLLIGCPDDFIDILRYDWENYFGFVVFKPLSVPVVNGHDNITCASRYVAKYCVKPSFLCDPLIDYGYCEKPRVLSSVGFGAPSVYDFKRLRDYYLCLDLWPWLDLYLEPMRILLSVAQPGLWVPEIIKRLQSSPIPKSLKKDIFFVDSIVEIRSEDGKVKKGKKKKPSWLWRLVSRTLSDLALDERFREYESLAAFVVDGENSEKISELSANIARNHFLSEVAREESLDSYQIKHLRRSRF